MLIIGLREPFPLMCLPPSLWSSTSLRSVIVTFIIMESYNPIARDTWGRSMLMRRVGVPGGDICDGSFHRDYTEDSQGEWRTGREVGISPLNFTPLASRKKTPGRLRRVSMKRGLGLFPWLRAGLFSSQAKQTEFVHRGAVE